MMKNIFIDTGAFIALISKDDNFHKQAVRIFQEAYEASHKLFTCDYVLDEFLTWARCKKKYSVDQIVSFINGLYVADIQIVGITRELFDDALKLMKKYDDQFFSFTDCVSFEVMKEMKIKSVISTDKHFTVAGFNNLL